MTDYPAHIVAEAERLLKIDSTTRNIVCLALTMTPPEPPKDVLAEAAYAVWPQGWSDVADPRLARDIDRLRTELARLGHEVAPVRQPVSDEVSLVAWLRSKADTALSLAKMNLPAISPTVQQHNAQVYLGLANEIERGIELAGGK